VDVVLRCYTASIWKDASDADTAPNHLATETLNLSSSDTLEVHLALEGGFVARLAPSGN
jgi:hypothetical protein